MVSLMEPKFHCEITSIYANLKLCISMQRGHVINRCNIHWLKTPNKEVRLQFTTPRAHLSPKPNVFVPTISFHISLRDSRKSHMQFVINKFSMRHAESPVTLFCNMPWQQKKNRQNCCRLQKKKRQVLVASNRIYIFSVTLLYNV